MVITMAPKGTFLDENALFDKIVLGVLPTRRFAARRFADGWFAVMDNSLNMAFRRRPFANTAVHRQVFRRRGDSPLGGLPFYHACDLSLHYD